MITLADDGMLLTGPEAALAALFMLMFPADDEPAVIQFENGYSVEDDPQNGIIVWLRDKNGIPIDCETYWDASEFAEKYHFTTGATAS